MSSKNPVSMTKSDGDGKLAGTIRIRSVRVHGWKCEAAVNRNIAANASRSAPVNESAACQELAKPIMRTTIQATAITTSGAMCSSFLDECIPSARERLE
jgi:hypothetical protein